MKVQHRVFVFVLAAVLAVWVGGFAAGLPMDEKQQERQMAEMKELDAYQETMNQGFALTEWEKIRFYELLERYSQDRSSIRPLDNQGGPDGFGYRFVDNQGGDSATYDWIELRGDPEAVWINNFSSHDDGYSQTKYPFGLNFPFYGQTYDSFRVACNGFMQFTTTSGSLSNACLPSTAVQGPAIFLFWNDLHLDRGGIPTGTDVVGYKNFGDYVVLEFDSVGNYSTSCVGSLKFEALLYADGRIKLQYSQLILGTGATCDSTMTIGIQSNGAAGSSALHYVCNTTGIQPVEGLAIWFAPSATGSVSGTVTDENAAPLPNARVRITETGSTAYTDAQGNYSFPMVAVGTYSMTATRHGYDPDTENNVVVTDGQNTDVDFQLTSQGYVIFTSNDVPQTIPTQGTVSSTLTIDEAGSIEDLDVMVNITHTYVGDLRITLTSPDNIPVVLTNRHGAGGDNFSSTIFDDEADSTIIQGTPPYNGIYSPEEPLSGFDANNMLGTWTLTIEDLAAGNGGTLNGWEIYVIAGPATGGSITGTVTSLASGEPLAGAVVEIVETQVSRTTGPNGQYTFNLVAAGTYSLHVTGGYYTPVTVPNVVVTEGQTTTVDVALPGSPTYSEDFEETDGGWIPTPATGGWEWGQPTGPGGPQPHSGTNVWGTVLAANYPNSACFDLDLALGLVVQSANAAVECWMWFSTETSFDGCHFKVSTDDGATWTLITPVGGYPRPSVFSNPCIGTNVPCWAGNSNGWIHVVLPLDDMVGLTPIFRFTFGSDGSITYPGVFIDDLAIWGLQPPFPVGTLSGTVRQFPSNTPLSGAWVIAGATDSIQSDAQGQYTMDIQTGTYTVTFRHATYCDSVRTGVEVLENETTILNVAMRSPNANISVSSIQHEGIAGQVTTSTFTIQNTGSCVLSYSMTDNQPWLSEAPAQGNVQANQSAEITVTYDATNLGIGDYSAQITITHSATGSPVNIPVDLHIPDAAGDEANLPTEFALLGNYPNPFNAVTEIRYDLPQAAFVTITLYNVLGQDVRTLKNGMMEAGHHVAVWDGRDDRGLNLTSGLYLMRLDAAGHSFVGKVMLLK